VVIPCIHFIDEVSEPASNATANIYLSYLIFFTLTVIYYLRVDCDEKLLDFAPFSPLYLYWDRSPLFP
jgi:hypothetical protein